jgi:tubulin monoglycylase TTLL15
MVSNLGNIVVNLTACVENNCQTNCYKSECDLCATCINNEILTNLHEAHREHTRRGGFKRIFPAKNHFEDNLIKKLTLQNKIAAKWFQEKCYEEQEWC